MTGVNILIWDWDSSYGNALSEYLSKELNSNISKAVITNIAKKDELNGKKVNFDFVIVNIRFAECFAEENLEFKFKNKIVLTEEIDEDIEEGYYKYQSMKPLLAEILRELRIDFFSNKGKETAIYGIYAPMGLSLSLPIGLCFAKLIGEEASTLFLDLSEVSILKDVVNFEIMTDLIDILYMMENGEIGSLGKYIMEQDGIYFLPPCLTPSQLSGISQGQWKALLEAIQECGYKNIVILFGSLIQGFADMAVNMKRVFVLGGMGEYAAFGMREFMLLMERLFIEDRCRELRVNLDVGSFGKAGISLESIFQGRLMEYVRTSLGGDIGTEADNYSN